MLRRPNHHPRLVEHVEAGEGDAIAPAGGAVVLVAVLARGLDADAISVAPVGGDKLNPVYPVPDLLPLVETKRDDLELPVGGPGQVTAPLVNPLGGV